MRQVPQYRWYVPHDWKPGKLSLTSFYMDEATAQERYPGCKPEPSSRRLQTVYEPGDEIPANSAPGAANRK